MLWTGTGIHGSPPGIFFSTESKKDSLPDAGRSGRYGGASGRAGKRQKLIVDLGGGPIQWTLRAFLRGEEWLPTARGSRLAAQTALQRPCRAIHLDTAGPGGPLRSSSAWKKLELHSMESIYTMVREIREKPGLGATTRVVTPRPLLTKRGRRQG